MAFKVGDVARNTAAIVGILACVCLVNAPPAIAVRSHAIALPVTITGVVTDTPTGRPIPHATVAAYTRTGVTLDTVHCDAAGHYQIHIAHTGQIQLSAAALGYGWSTVIVDIYSNSPGGIADFRGPAGLRSLFLPLNDRDNGDTLDRFSQAITTQTTSLAFSGVHVTALQSAYAVTYPDGTAASYPLALTGTGYSGTLRFDHGVGVYQLEINELGGLAVFNLPIYYGITPALGAPPILYPPDKVNPSSQAERSLALSYVNEYRVRAGQPPVRESATLDAVALAHSRDILQHPGQWANPHVGSDGSTVAQRVRSGGVPFAASGETMVLDTEPGASRLESLRRAIDGLMASPGHRISLLFGAFDRAGVGIAGDSAGHEVLTIDFAASVCHISIYGTLRASSGAALSGASLSDGAITTTTAAGGAFTLPMTVTVNTPPTTTISIKTSTGLFTLTLHLPQDIGPTASVGPIAYGPLPITLPD